MSATPLVLLPGAARSAPEPDAAEAAVLAAAAEGGAGVEPMVDLLSRAAPGHDDGALALDLPLTGEGRTRRQWELLASTAAVSLSAARVLEPHLDALSILSQAGVPAPAGLLGVYASESGGVTPAVRPVPDAADGAAEDVDAGRLDGAHGQVEADRIRGTVAQLCTEVLDVVGQATGPGPLTGDAAHARAVADLQVYLRQHHGHRDDARLAEGLLALDPAEHAEVQPW